MSNIVKNTAFPKLLDLIAPHSCRGCGAIGSPICSRCKKYITKNHVHTCPRCKSVIAESSRPTPCKNCRDLPPIYAVGERTGLLDVIIRDFKYQSVHALARPLAELLDDILPSDIKNAVIVPLPTATHHIRARGLDHTLLIARHLAHLRHCQVSPLLSRTKNTVQVGKDIATRKVQAASAYSLRPKLSVSPAMTYIILDDVWTTGASTEAAIKILRSAGAENLIVALLAYSV